MIVRDSTVLPDPDSPTMPNVWFVARSKETLPTAVRGPSRVANVVVRSLTTSSVEVSVLTVSRPSRRSACAAGRR